MITSRSISRLPKSARRVVLFVNPTAGAGGRHGLIDELADRLRADAWTVEIVSDPDQLTDRIGRDCDPSIRAVVAAGGDGTVSTALNRSHPDTPIAILPLGTENLMARYLKAEPHPARLCQVISQGVTVRLDAGMAADRIFMLMVGCGFDAEVVRRLQAGRRGHIRHLSYLKPLLDTIRSYAYPELKLYCGRVEGAQWGSEHAMHDGSAVEARWAFVVNLPNYAGGLRFVPSATGTDGLLDVCAFEHGSVLAGLRYLTGVATGRHLGWPDCTHLRTAALRIESAEEVHYQLDGDYGGTLPLDIGVLPERMRMMVDESWAVAHQFRPGTGEG